MSSHCLHDVLWSNPVTYDGSAIVLFTGCSAASPLVAGTVSLLLAQDPTLDQAAVYELPRSTEAALRA